MKLNDLKSARGARKAKKRVGRGNGSGRGTFCTRGCKGQNSRSDGGVRLGFEGGQTPLLRRIPKLKGFKNPNREEFFPLNLATVESCFAENETVSPQTLLEKKIMRKKNQSVKVLGNGSISKKVNFKNVAFSKVAKEKVEKAGGKIE